MLDLEALVAMGGIEDLLRGLRTNAERGLSTEDPSTRIHEKYDLGSGASHSEISRPSGNIGTPTDDRSAFTASFGDWKRVYGEEYSAHAHQQDAFAANVGSHER